MNYLRLIFKYIYPLLFFKNEFTIKEKVANKNLTVFIRPRSIDLQSIAEVFHDQVYEPLFPIKNIQTIIDLGAHTGESAIWLARRFNPKKLIAVELNPQTCKMASKNIAVNNFKNIIPLNNAVFSTDDKNVGIKSSFISLMDRVDENNTNKTIKTISLKSLIKLAREKLIDYLKIDIEGSEKFILTPENADLLKSKVRFIALECHPILGYQPKEAVIYLKNLGFVIKFKKTGFTGWFFPIIHAFNPGLN